VNLVGGDRRSPEQSESYVSEGAVLCRARGPVFTLHHAIVRCRTAKRDSISRVVGAHAGKRTAASDSSFKVVDMRRLQVWPGRLIVAAILIQPRNRVGLGAAIRRGSPLLHLLSGSRRGYGECRSDRGDGRQEVSSIADWTRSVN
jgi:hypothetical protein